MYYYTGSQDCQIYVGKDKEENELLIKHGWDRDVWFHVDKLSSAHVYLRMPAGMDWQDIPQDIVEDCCQLTKANSIQGNKKDNIVVIYTPWENLKKDGSMAVGQVGFKKDRVVKRFKVHSRDNTIINRLNKTKTEKFPDLELEKLEYEKMLKRQYADEHRARQKIELEQNREYKKIAAQKDKGYLDLFDEEAIAHNSNQFRADDWEDDFM